MQQLKQVSTTSLQHQHNWENFDVNTIISGKTRDGVKYLELFLQDYTQLFKGKVNPSCPSCIRTYLNKYKSKIFEMDSNCDYKLHKKYNGIQLGHGGQVLSNRNLTNELAEKLIENHKSIHERRGTEFKIDLIFQVFPKDWDKKEIKVEKPKQQKPKKKRNPRKKSE